MACGDANGNSVPTSWLATAGVTYHLMVATGGGVSGISTLNVTSALPPANDDFDRATIVSSVPFTDQVDTSGATTAADDPTGCTQPRNSVWYSFTPPVNETVTIGPAGSTGVFVSAYSGSRGHLTQVACGNTQGFSFQVSWPATAGVTYHIMVSNANFIGGPSGLNLSAQVPQPPAITSSATATFLVNAFSPAFTVTTTGSPTPALSEVGALPAGLQFTDNGNGTAYLYGVPTTTGTTVVTVTAHNAAGPDATQALTVIVAKGATNTGLSESTLTPVFGSPILFRATVSPALPTFSALTGTVNFYIDNQTTPVATVPLSFGTASFTTSGLGAGTHSVRAAYGGDATFAASSSLTDAITVTTAQTITGTHHGALTVAAGSTVLVRDASIQGAVSVLPGGAIDVENSTISGALNAPNPSAVRICASTLHGAVNITRSTGFVLIGDSGDDGCAANTITGAVNLQNDTHGLEVVGNHVTGQLNTSGNSGAGAFPEDNAPEVENNGR